MWVAISFPRGSSRLRDQTQLSCIGGSRFTLWATREAHLLLKAKVQSKKISRLLSKVRKNKTKPNPKLRAVLEPQKPSGFFNLILQHLPCRKVTLQEPVLSHTEINRIMTQYKQTGAKSQLGKWKAVLHPKELVIQVQDNLTFNLM